MLKEHLSIFSDEDLAEIVVLLRNKDFSGWFKSSEGGPYLQEFQDRFAAFCGAKHAFAVSSGSAAIYTALRACGIGRGNFVAVPAYTHIGSVAPIYLAEAHPVFVDVDKYGNMDPADLEKVMSRKIRMFNGRDFIRYVVGNSPDQGVKSPPRNQKLTLRYCILYLSRLIPVHIKDSSPLQPLRYLPTHL
ncbi:unnamed protein product [marine sediment metagenome]|uniref:DegT/DnrJ/EryC1/StrS aminotransferase family protein n=1 Tax=marine sediment metagenome TaxID=412755 RepID=X1T6P0_9ZZZZ